MLLLFCLGKLVMDVIEKFRPHATKCLFLLAGELLRLGCAEDTTCPALCVDLIQCILTPASRQESDQELSGEDTLLDDSLLISLLELIVKHSCYDLVDVAYKWLSRRTLNSMTPPLPPSGCGLVGCVKDMIHFDTKLSGKETLLSIPIHPCPVPLQSVSAVPFQRGSSLAVMLSCISELCASVDMSTSCLTAPVLTVSEDLVQDLLRVCACGRGLPCAKLLLMLCRASPHARTCFESSYLREVCERMGGGGSGGTGTLFLLSKYLELVVADNKEKGIVTSGEAVKLIRKLVLERCLEIVSDSLSSELQVRV